MRSRNKDIYKQWKPEGKESGTRRGKQIENIQKRIIKEVKSFKEFVKRRKNNKDEKRE